MNIVILTRDDHEHIYVANQLCHHFKVERIIVDKGIRRSRFAKIRSYWKRYKIGIFYLLIRKILNVIVRDGQKRRLALLNVLGDENTKFTDQSLVEYVDGVNSLQSETLLTVLNPDVLAVYGTSIVKDRILNLAKHRALNMHTGKSPYYRGTACAFWPLYNDEPEYLGATVHECCGRVDGGEIYGVTSAQLQQTDDMHAVFARCVAVGAAEYVAVIEKLLDGTLKGVAQDLTLGREYRASEKTWLHEYHVKGKIRKGLVRNYVNNRKLERCV
ncbi:MAG: formyl transferase [Desulfobulbus sp.]|nr:formyl transferase [Desulfobulbus sp.]